jgi:hypothetical protein
LIGLSKTRADACDRLAQSDKVPPTRRGFGSVILLEAAEQFGSVTATYLPEGLIYQLQLDLKAIEIPRTVIPLPNANIARSVGNS